MNEEEKELYGQIKNDPDNFMFGLLFEYDENGNVKPIQGQTLKLMPDGIPMILDRATANLISKNLSDNPSAFGTTNNSFTENSNEKDSESPFGKKSLFYKEGREILKGQIPKL